MCSVIWPERDEAWHVWKMISRRVKIFNLDVWRWRRNWDMNERAVDECIIGWAFFTKLPAALLLIVVVSSCVLFFAAETLPHSTERRILNSSKERENVHTCTSEEEWSVIKAFTIPDNDIQYSVWEDECEWFIWKHKTFFFLSTFSLLCSSRRCCSACLSTPIGFDPCAAGRQAWKWYSSVVEWYYMYVYGF